MSDANSESSPVHHEWTAERLLRAIEAEPTIELAMIARAVRVSEARLIECRAGRQPLEPDEQMRLAAVVAELSPSHRRLAHRLYAQAQTALRMALGEVTLHSDYPRGLTY